MVSFVRYKNWCVEALMPQSSKVFSLATFSINFGHDNGLKATNSAHSCQHSQRNYEKWERDVSWLMSRNILMYLEVVIFSIFCAIIICYLLISAIK